MTTDKSSTETAAKASVFLTPLELASIIQDDVRSLRLGAERDQRHSPTEDRATIVNLCVCVETLTELVMNLQRSLNQYQGEV